jgi:hypothetical protein
MILCSNPDLKRSSTDSRWTLSFGKRKLLPSHWMRASLLAPAPLPSNPLILFFLRFDAIQCERIALGLVPLPLPLLDPHSVEFISPSSAADSSVP